jgi:hypothetical protein
MGVLIQDPKPVICFSFFSVAVPTNIPAQIQSYSWNWQYFSLGALENVARRHTCGDALLKGAPSGKMIFKKRGILTRTF